MSCGCGAKFGGCGCGGSKPDMSGMLDYKTGGCQSCNCGCDSKDCGPNCPSCNCFKKTGGGTKRRSRKLAKKSSKKRSKSKTKGRARRSKK